ncbi:response regulator, partial [Parasedimentitalea huanghaiensis]
LFRLGSLNGHLRSSAFLIIGADHFIGGGSASNGDEAAKILFEVQGFDLLITDVAMPGTLQGYDLFDYGKQLNPDLKCIIISGHAPSPTDLDGALNSGAKFLRKPIRRKLLLNTVNELAH